MLKNMGVLVFPCVFACSFHSSTARFSSIVVLALFVPTIPSVDEIAEMFLVRRIYIHWDAYGPKQWKIGTLYGIIRRAYDICSTEEARKTELEFIYKVFTEINGYPESLV